MDAYPAPDSIKKRHELFKAIIIEVGVILLLVFGLLFVLNYLKVIDVVALLQIRNENSSKPFASNNAIPTVSPTQSISLEFSVKPSTIVPKGSEFSRLLATKKATHYSYSVTEYEGKIATVDTVAGKDKEYSIPYKYRLVITLGEGNDITPFLVLIPEESLSVLKIQDSSRNILDFTDLKPDDSVVVKVTIDFLKKYPNNYQEILITTNP